MFSQHLLKSHLLHATPPLRFPQKLWKIANECDSGAVSWSPDGKTILLRYSLFREEFMSTKSDFFKTDNISSFVRQLNLYGFRKVYEHAHKHAYKANPDLHEFSNSYFQRERPDLLDKVTRKSGALKERNDFWTDNRKSLDHLEEVSCDKLWDNTSVLIGNDHSYLGVLKNEIPAGTPAVNELEEKIIEVVEHIHAKNVPLQSFQTPTGQTPAPDPNCLAPVKKKRGRKPGSKRNPKKNVHLSNRTIYYSPVLKNPENYPNLMYFNDDEDNMYLRNTSRDVMLSSTLPFQETSEYLELKETYHRLYDPKLRIRYGFLPFLSKCA